MHRGLYSLHALIRRLGGEIPVAILAALFGAVGLAEEVETLLISINDSGLGFVQGESEPSHRLPRPLQRLGRSTSAEDDEIIGIVERRTLHPGSVFHAFEKVTVFDSLPGVSAI